VRRLGPGSYMMQPGGNYKHTTSCDKASECIFFVESGGAFDLKQWRPEARLRRSNGPPQRAVALEETAPSGHVRADGIVQRIVERQHLAQLG
jgi:hypothetical protein